MDEHRLRLERSIALHEAVAEKLRAAPEILERARIKLDQWLARGGASTPLLVRWREILALPPEEIAAQLAVRSEEADWLRKASPFAGALEPRERERILCEVRRRLELAT